MGLWGRFVDSISSRLAFFPPDPPSYTCSLGDDKQLKICTASSYVNKLNRYVTFATVETPKRGGGGGESILTAWIPYGTSTTPTILYSHANAVDLGRALPLLWELGRALRVNIFAYDYSGYGASTGQPSVCNTLADIAAAFDFLCSQYNKQPEDICLYGQSVGSGPTVHLASMLPTLAGVVLHTPLLSGIRVLSPGLKCWPRCADVYPNMHYIKSVKAPTLVMHGTHDEVIDFRHGTRLHELAANPYEHPLWAQGHNHQNLETSREYVPCLQKFLDHVFQRRPRSAHGVQRRSSRQVAPRAPPSTPPAVGSPVPPSPAPASDKLSLPQAIQLGAEFASSSTPLSEIDPDTPLPAQDASAPCTPQTSSDQLREVRSSLRGIAPSPLDTSPGESTALTAAMSPFPSAGQISARRGGGSSRDVGDLITPPSC